MSPTTPIVFTEAEQEAIRRAASAVWTECAYDLLEAVAEEKGKSVNVVTIPRAEAMEIALDAGRAEERMRRNPDLTPDFFARYNRATYKELIAIVKPAFPHARYGL